MDGWQRINGVDWLCVEPVSGGDGSVEAGLIIGHGYAREAPVDLGLGAAAMTALVRELNRPRETGDLRVVELSAAAQVNLQDTVLRLVGSPDAVRLGLVALDALLSDPSWVDVDELPNPPTYVWSGWTSELTAWFGMGPAVFATEYERPWSGDPQRLRQLLGDLHPGRGAHVVGWTSDQSLLGLVFRGADPALTTPESAAANHPLRWRDPSPVADGPRSVVGTFHNNLLTVRLREDPVSSLALRLLARTVRRNLVEFTQLVRGLDLIVEQVGGESLFALRAVPNEQGYDTGRPATPCSRRSTPTPDSPILCSPRSWTGPGSPRHATSISRRAVVRWRPSAALGDPSGTRSSASTKRSPSPICDGPPTASANRRCSASAARTTRRRADRSGDRLRSPRWVAPEWSRRSRVRLPMDGAEKARPRISANASALEVTATPRRSTATSTA